MNHSGQSGAIVADREPREGDGRRGRKAKLSAKHIVRTDRSLPCSFGKLRRAPVPLLRDSESVNICGSTEVFVDVSCSDAVPVMPE